MTRFGSGAVKNGFCRLLMGANHLDQCPGFDRLLFFEGMCFGSRQTWWPGGGRRPQSHEGLDLCFFADPEGHKYRLDETVRVPAAFDCRVEAVIPDFLGATVIAAHGLPGGRGKCLMFYAHISPDRGLQIGQSLAAGQGFAFVAGPHKKRLLPPHLHLSMAGADSLPAVQSLGWPLINRLDRSRFLDPLRILGADWQIMEFRPETDLYETFTPVGLLQDLQTIREQGKSGPAQETP